MAYNVQEQLRPASLLREALEPLKPKAVSWESIGRAWETYSPIDCFTIEFEDGDRVNLEGWHVRGLIDRMDRDRMAAMRNGVIPRDISSQDFRDLYLLAVINAHKEIQNSRCAS
jgi:hypothetical protein